MLKIIVSCLIKVNASSLSSITTNHKNCLQLKRVNALLPCKLISRQTPVQPGFLCILPWSRRLPVAARRTPGWPNDPDLRGSPYRHVRGNLRVLCPDEEGCRMSRRSSSSPPPRSASAPCRKRKQRRWWRAAADKWPSSHILHHLELHHSEGQVVSAAGSYVYMQVVLCHCQNNQRSPHRYHQLQHDY